MTIRTGVGHSESAKANSVRSLETLYTTVVGLGVSVSLLKVVDAPNRLPHLRTETLLLLASYLVTLIPFYHGALRHLEATYIEHGGRSTRSGALFVDFLMVLLEGCLIFVIAVLLADPRSFAVGLAVLLVFDAFWGIVAHLGFSRELKAKPELRWAILNTGAAAVLVLYLGILGGFSSPLGHFERNLDLKLGVLAIAIVRSVLDYALCWRCYYPSE